MIIVNGHSVNPIKFPAGECGVRLTMDHIHQTPTNRKGHYNVLWEFESPSEYFVLAQTIDALKSATRGIHRVRIDLLIPYFPFGRQDRAVNFGESNALRVFCQALNNLDIDTITTWDPHSLAIEQHFDSDKFVYIPQDELFEKYAPEVMKTGVDVVVAPDAGASKKAAAVAKLLGAKLVQCSKERDKLTGEVLYLKFDDSLAVSTASKVLVVDDICDGGATFIAVSKAFTTVKMKPDACIYLYTTHGIYSKGIGVLTPHYAEIACVYRHPAFVNI